MKQFLFVASILVGLLGTTNAQENLDRYGGTTAIKRKATGFFHIEQIDGRNWFITPDGNAFFAVTLSHLFSGESDLACKNVYGGDVDDGRTKRNSTNESTKRPANPFSMATVDTVCPTIARGHGASKGPGSPTGLLPQGSRHPAN